MRDQSISNVVLNKTTVFEVFAPISFERNIAKLKCEICF